MPTFLPAALLAVVGSLSAPLSTNGNEPAPPALTAPSAASPFAADPSESAFSPLPSELPTLDGHERSVGSEAAAADAAAQNRARLYQHAPDVDEEDEPPVNWRIGDRRSRHKAHDFSALFGLWTSGINGALLYAIPVAQRGLVPINDAFFIEFGLLMLGTNLRKSYSLPHQFDLLPNVGVRWDFYLSDLVRLFATLKMGPRIGVQGSKEVYPDPIVGGGATLQLARRAHMRLELNYPQGFTFGLQVPIGHVP